MTLPYDFYIGDLGFNKKISVDTPEERATAPFKKDQFDTAQRVGDQSLTGWWTRGQLSFHKGAGLNYYEVLESETVLDRYKDSEGVDVFTPGQATLTRKLSSIGVDATDAVPGSLAGGGGVYALTSTGVEYTNGSGTLSLDTSDGNIPTAITVSGDLYYVVNGTKIERQFAAADARVNHVTNPSFETDASGWTVGTTAPAGASALSPTRIDLGKYGSHAYYLSYFTGVNGYPIWMQTTVSGLTVGVTYVASAWVKFSGRGVGGGINMSIAGASADSAINTADWMNLRVVFTASATSHVIKFTGKVSPGGSTEYVITDSVMVTESPFVGDYFDGSQPGCSWQGTPNNSKSNYVTASNGASTERITSSDAAWDGVWWAKGRLWLVDDARHWYALADQVATVTNADAFWTSTNESATWSLTDSPGPVYISDGSDIFAITLDTDGLVPAIGTPTTVARLPLGEQVVRIAYYLNNLVVITTRGVRVAVVQNDKLFLGPLTIKGDFTKCIRIGSYDATAYLTGRLDGRGGDVVLCAIDLTAANDDLTFPWSPLATLATDSSTSDGCVVDAAGCIYAWSAGDLLGASLDELSSTGYIETAYHRFGTLDSKYFATASVRLKGTGQVEVFAIDEAGTETSLGTLDAAGGLGELTLPGVPAERLALRFILSRDGSDSTKGPTLLGYQLRALPVPKRQRLIRVPLMLFDREVDGRTRTKRGAPGQAWTRLAALEDLEQSNAVVTFSDSETGETGSGYIESVEVRRTAPTSRHEDGFGGLLYVTIRKLG